jgi:signal transduction histidine kinase
MKPDFAILLRRHGMPLLIAALLAGLAVFWRPDAGLAPVLAFGFVCLFCVIQGERTARKARAEFLSQLGHDLRTPLTAIAGVAEIYSSAPEEPGSSRKYLAETLSASVTSLRDVVEGLLDAVRLEDGDLAPEAREFPLQALLGEISGVAAARARDAGASFSLDAAAEGVFLGDRARLRRILLALAAASLRAVKSGGGVAAAARLGSDGSLRVDFRGAGPGFTPPEAARLAEGFSQDSLVALPEGLATARAVARLMGGGIALSGDLAQGFVFTFSVPPAKNAGKNPPVAK